MDTPRLDSDLEPNAVARARAARDGKSLIDLTSTNPTACGLLRGSELLARALAEVATAPEALRYRADPRGPEDVRAAIAAYHGNAVTADDVILTAGTSEGYAHLFRLLCAPGDVVHVPRPGYPLFEQLARLEGVAAEPYLLRAPRESGTRWRIALDSLEARLTPRSRAIVLIHPHNPTGSFVDEADFAALGQLARERDVALICDEVFASASLTGHAPPGALVQAADAPLCFVLSGASKSLAVPQLKVAWIAVGGYDARAKAITAKLEHIADTFLSVSPLLAGTLPHLIPHCDAIASEIRARVATNRRNLASELAWHGSGVLLPADAGWAGVLRVSGLGPEDEEAVAVEMISRDGVAMHPGYFFDLGRGPTGPAAHFVVSLLSEPGRAADGARRLATGLRRELESRSARSSSA